MTSTFIPNSELKDISTLELQSKFFDISRELVALRQKAAMIPHAEASLNNIRTELAMRRARHPQP